MRLIYFIILYLLTSSLLYAQVIDGLFKTKINYPALPQYELIIAIKMQSGIGSAGIISVEFSYLTSVLGFPNTPVLGTDYILFDEFANYYTRNITRPSSDKIRVNLITMGIPAPVALDTIFKDVIKLNFTVINSIGHSSLTWTQTNVAPAFLMPSYTIGTWLNIEDFPIPVELTGLTASVIRENDIELRWQTVTESNNSGFEIERKPFNNSEWKSLCFIQGAGNSSTPKQYVFIDKKLTGSNKFEYRLKQIDYNNTFNYSNIIAVEIKPLEYLIHQNYPNPFNSSTMIDYQLPFESNVKLELFGINGEKIISIVDERLAAGYYTAAIDSKEIRLASGIYLYRIIAREMAGDKLFTQVKKCLLMK